VVELATFNILLLFLNLGGAVRCIGDTLAEETLMVGDFSIGNGYSQEIDVYVIDPKGNQIWTRSNAAKGKFAITSTIEGEYKVCFKNRLVGSISYQEGMSRAVTVDLRSGVEANDYDAIAKKEHLNPIDLQVRKMSDLVLDLHFQMSQQKQREEAMRNTNESTNSRVMWFSLFSILVLFSTSFWQTFHLKKYFRSKKLI